MKVEKSLFLKNHNFIACFLLENIQKVFLCENNNLFDVGGKGILNTKGAKSKDFFFQSPVKHPKKPKIEMQSKQKW